MHLTPEQRDAFARDGVLSVGRVLDDAQVAEARDRLERLIAADKMDKPQSDAGGYTFRRLNVSSFDPWFGSLVRTPAVLDPAESVLGPDLQYYQDNIFYKPAGVGADTPFHQDNIWWRGDPPAMLTLWIALDPADAGNGGVEYVRGSHAALIDHTLPVQDPGGFSYNVIDPQRVDRGRVATFTLAPGEAVMHHCLTIHGAPANASPRPRRGYTVHLMRAGLFPGYDHARHPLLRGKMPEAAA